MNIVYLIKKLGESGGGCPLYSQCSSAGVVPRELLLVIILLDISNVKLRFRKKNWFFGIKRT
jgi:hypothetical protein